MPLRKNLQCDCSYGEVFELLATVLDRSICASLQKVKEAKMVGMGIVSATAANNALAFIQRYCNLSFSEPSKEIKKTI